MAKTTQTFPDDSPDIHKDGSTTLSVPNSQIHPNGKGTNMSRREVFSSAAAVALPTEALATVVPTSAPPTKTDSDVLAIDAEFGRLYRKWLPLRMEAPDYYVDVEPECDKVLEECLI